MMPENENSPPTNPGADRLPGARPSRQAPWIAVAIAALALAGWQWFETRQKLIDTQQEVSRKLAEFDTGNKEERGARKQTSEQIEALQARLGALDGKLAEFQGQSATLQTLYQDIARSRLEHAGATILHWNQHGQHLRRDFGDRCARPGGQQSVLVGHVGVTGQRYMAVVVQCQARTKYLQVHGLAQQFGDQGHANQQRICGWWRWRS